MKISSPEAMFALGQELAKSHKILFLEGDLGAGKTLLTKGFAQGIGLNPDQVQSPTYAYLNRYEGKLLHLDMYRLQTYEDMVAKGILAQIHEHEYLAIEWPKFIDQLGLPSYTLVQITKISPEEREVEIVNN
jgi:tRNA threonylcarbamoyladenosine biosynthesis protein TsaE